MAQFIKEFPLDDLRLNPLGPTDWYAGQTKDNTKKRPRHPHHTDPPDEPVDIVTLSSDAAHDSPPEDQSA